MARRHSRGQATGALTSTAPVWLATALSATDSKYVVTWADAQQLTATAATFDVLSNTETMASIRVGGTDGVGAVKPYEQGGGLSLNAGEALFIQTDVVANVNYTVIYEIESIG